MNEPTTPLDHFNRLWDGPEIPQLTVLAERFARLDSLELVLLLQQDQRNRCGRGCEIPAEQYLEQFADQLGESEQLDLIYHEFILCEESGESPNSQEYISRFPALADPIGRQLALHEALLEKVQVPTEDVTAAMTLTGPATTAAPLPSLNGFEIEGVLGRGAMGVVYRATESALRRPVAIKMLLSGRHASPQEIERLQKEAEAAARLRHANIVTIHQVGTADGVPYLVMELIEGQTLADLLRAGPLAIEPAISIAETVCRAVEFANSQSIIHRDLKPANILLDQKLKPSVTDFGLARVVDEAPSLSGNVVGTPQYMSPEQARGEKIDATSDVYSIGVILYEMLTGRPPFQAATSWDVIRMLLERDPPRLRDLNPSVPRDLQTVCEKCIEKDPSRRYQSSLELAEELDRIRTGRPVQARPIGRVHRLVKWCRRNRMTAGLLSVVAMTLVGVTVGSLLVAAQLSSANEAITKSETRAKTAEQLALADREAAVESFNSLVEDLYNDLSRQGGTIRSREAIIDNALAGLQSISERARGREVDRNLAVAYLRTGDLRTLSAEPAAALSHYETAIDIAKQVTDAFPDDRLARLTLGRCYEALGLYHFRFGETEKGAAALDGSISVLRALLQDGSDDPQALTNLVIAYNHRNDIAWRGNDVDGQLAACRDAEPYALKLAGSSTSMALAAAAGHQQRFGRALSGQNAFADALPYFQRATELADAACERSPDDDTLRTANLAAMRLLANCRISLGRTETAVPILEQVVVGTQTLVDEDPNDSLRQGELVVALLALGQAEYAFGDMRGAFDAYHRAREIQTKLIAENPAYQLARMGYCQSCVEMVLLPVFLDRDWEATGQLLADFRRAFAGEGDQKPLDANVMYVQLMLADLVEESVLRRLQRWEKPTTDNGTAVLIALELFLSAEDAAPEPLLSETTKSIVPASARTDYDAVFAYCRSLSLDPLPAAYVRNLEARSCASFAERAENAGNDDLRKSWLDRGLQAVDSIRSEYPMFAAPLIDTDGELTWLRATPEFVSSATAAQTPP